MENYTPMSLKQRALNETVSVYLNNPDLLLNVPNPLRAELAEKCYNTLSDYGKYMNRVGRRKNVTLDRFVSINNSEEYKLIPPQFKKINSNRVKRATESLDRELEVLAKLIKYSEKEKEKEN
jgi:hypothetical protein